MTQLIALLLAGVLFAPSVQNPSQAVESPNCSRDASCRVSHETLQGTWRVNVTLVNCKTGAFLRGPFLSLLTFADGGTMTETTSNPSFYPAVRSPGHGVWRRQDRAKYGASTIALITQSGVLTEIQVINQTIELQPGADEFRTLTASVHFSKPDGTPLPVSGCASAVGKRFELM